MARINLDDRRRWPCVAFQAAQLTFPPSRRAHGRFRRPCGPHSAMLHGGPAKLCFGRVFLQVRSQQVLSQETSHGVIFQGPRNDLDLGSLCKGVISVSIPHVVDSAVRRFDSLRYNFSGRLRTRWRRETGAPSHRVTAPRAGAVGTRVERALPR